MTETELAFAAGLLEGEGTIRLNRPTKRNKGALLVSCVNTDRELISFLQDRWPGYCKPATGLRSGQRPAFVWVIAALKALSFLEEIEPYVVTHRMRERIRTARWWQTIKAKHWRYRTEDDFEESFNCWHWMAELNRRGTCPNADEHRRS